MNIFKVLASRKKFPEEMMSVLLGYLMHPEMDHGLGRRFIKRLLLKIVSDSNSELISQFNTLSDDKITCSLEENVNTAFVDIVYFVGDHVIAIENKVYDESVDEGQLEREFEGLRKKYPTRKITMVYLVPHISPSVKAEYGNLVNIVRLPHSCVLITWESTLIDIIKDLISEDSKNNVTPFPEETLYILESIRSFVKDKYNGYNFVIRKGVNGNRSNFSRSTYAELKTKRQGFVGVALGTAGLMKMSKDDILSKGFQYDDSDECDRQYWLPLSEFINLADQRINGVAFPVRMVTPVKSRKMSNRGSVSSGYMGKLNSAQIYSLVKEKNSSRYFIGIKRGELGFIDMPQQKVDKMSWQVTSGKQPNSQWISGDRYKELYETKFPGR